MAAMGAAIVPVVRDRRGYQDYSTWQNFGTAQVWAECRESPELACEVVSQHVHRLGLINPSEQTSADITAGILVAQRGDFAPWLPPADIAKMFDWFKVRHA